MDINKIKYWLEDELSKGNPIYKKVLSFCIKLYKLENKNKVAVWNANYRDKLRKLKGNPHPKPLNKVVYSPKELNKVDCGGCESVK